MSTTTMVRNTDLKTGMKIVIPAGDTLSIEGQVYPSSISEGCIVAETNIGPVYFAGHLHTRVLGPDEITRAAPAGP